MNKEKGHSNSNLHKASKGKNDEFYTELVDIEKELKNYKDQFKGKIVYCNCDDPFESNFFKYFASNFKALKLKRLIATSYKPSPIANTQLGLFGDDKTLEPSKGRPKNNANKFIINDVSDIDGDGAFDLRDISEQLKANKNNEWSPMEGDGDFRSLESIELLKQADIVITNPPFSLFREYIAQLFEYNKKFLILGNMNAITYKEVFKFIKENKLWSGYGFNMSMVYKTPYSNTLEANQKFVIGKGYNPNDGYVKVPAVNWYTNLDTDKRHEELILYKKYSLKEYPKYDNYDAIEVSKVSDIPMDYKGAMGVPITFLNKYNPEQFEIIWIADRQNSQGLRTKTYTANDTPNYNDLNRGPVIKMEEKLQVVYMRILIRNKKPQK